ncbi:MAG: hypothetical protein IJT88_04670 [Kiritimatiellae bacterium]|nr:hypothetical protein [Kiritimatiellia bacterium]
MKSICLYDWNKKMHGKNMFLNWFAPFLPLLCLFPTLCPAEPLRMRGGLPQESLWNEYDVIHYLSLPAPPRNTVASGHSLQRLTESLETACSSATGEIPDTSRWIPATTFAPDGLERDLAWNGHQFKLGVFPASSFDAYTANLCQWIMDTVPLWNCIPEYYVREESEDWVSLTKSEGYAHRWCFAKNGSCVLVIARDETRPPPNLADSFPTHAAALQTLLLANGFPPPALEDEKRNGE